MAVDPYAPCPGGTGKKIKFCCPDRMSELDELGAMLQGQQHVAAIRYLDGIEAQGPPRACLWAIKIRLLRILQREQAGAAAVAAFLGHFPDNPIALAESAVQRTLGGELPQAVALLQQALAVRDEIEPQVYEALGTVAEALADRECFSAARVHWQLQALAIGGEESAEPVRNLVALGRASNVPILLKDDLRPAACPPGAAWRERFEEAMKLVLAGRWLSGGELLEALARDVPDAPAIWRNLALVRGWLANEPGQVEALRRFAALDVPLEDAAEAEATAALLSEDELGDRVDMVWQTYTLGDADHVAAVLATSKLTVPLEVDPRRFQDEEIPPKAGFHVTDLPLPETAALTRLDAIPRVLGQVFVFGRQTDREARLLVVTRGPAEREKMTALLSEWVGGELVGEPREEVVGRVSASVELLRREWRFPPNVAREQIGAMVREHVDRALLEQWPRVKLGLLEGRSPEEAAGLAHLRVKLLAAILVLETWVQLAGDRFDFDRLRARLGLPLLAPIDPDGVSLEELPLVRLRRVMADKLSDEALQAAFGRAVMHVANEAMGKFAQVLIDRPGISDKVKLGAYHALVRIERNSDLALTYLDQGRQTAEAAGQSSAMWDLMELYGRTERGEFEDVGRLLEHIQRDHGREPGVNEAIMRFLVSVGAIRPDGTPREADSETAPIAEDLPAEPPDLWSPEGPVSTTASARDAAPQRSKLWVPGMD